MCFGRSNSAPIPEDCQESWYEQRLDHFRCAVTAAVVLCKTRYWLLAMTKCSQLQSPPLAVAAVYAQTHPRYRPDNLRVCCRWHGNPEPTFQQRYFVCAQHWQDSPAGQKGPIFFYGEQGVAGDAASC